MNSFIKQTNDALYAIDSEKQLLERQLSKLTLKYAFANEIANIVRDVPVISSVVLITKLSKLLLMTWRMTLYTWECQK